MTTWKIVVEYDGTEFAGWQIQPKARTVQAELDRALSTVLRRETKVQGAGRTDAGRYLMVYFIWKSDARALPISARDMTDKEKRRYGKKKTAKGE